MTRDVVFDRVWKRFRVGEVHDSLRDLLPALLRRVAGRWTAAPAARRDRVFWALRDVSFRVRPGEALGILGANGAGKSTVLKVLTGILEPTHGRCAAPGRVGALIEVAAGFHPDLTGRENVLLQGSFMGMSRREIAGKFDQIVDFAGIGAFIDTPVKRYSSGMNARLGFAIAAHLDPDVLVIDEVLAVGDAAFQRKAFARITELVRRDIPVLIVSHQLDQIAALCTHALVLDQGRVVKRGTPAECIASYLEREFATGARGGPGAVEIDSMGASVTTITPSGGRLSYWLRCWVRDPSRTGQETVGLRVRSAEGAVVFAASAGQMGADLPRDGWYWLRASLQLNVPPGAYTVESYVWDEGRGQEMESGPVVATTVTAGPAFTGAVQMNATAEVSHAAVYGEEHGWRPRPAGDAAAEPGAGAG
jgi:ABC-type polysaccharide/polyol phosphate transport system ATPase subunit